MLGIALLAAAVTLKGAAAPGPETLVAPPAHEAAATRPDPLATFAGLAGVWTGELGGTRLEEVWLPAHGRNMTGCVRWFRPDGTVRMLELLTLNAADDAVRLSIRHFDGSMTPWPDEAEGPMVLALEPGKGTVRVFRGAERAGAVRAMTYDLQGPDSLTITLVFGDGREPLVIPLNRAGAQAARP